MERAHPGLVLGAPRTVVTATIASLLRSLQRFLAVQECLTSTMEGLVHRSALGRHGVGLHSVELSVQLVEGAQVGLERGELGPIELASIVSLSQPLERCVAIPNGFTGTAVDLAERSLGSCGGAELSLLDGTSGGGSCAQASGPTAGRRFLPIPASCTVRQAQVNERKWRRLQGLPSPVRTTEARDESQSSCAAQNPDAGWSIERPVAVSEADLTVTGISARTLACEPDPLCHSP